MNLDFTNGFLIGAFIGILLNTLISWLLDKACE